MEERFTNGKMDRGSRGSHRGFGMNFGW